jgi:glycyl-tRNA synthetase beta chain
MRSSYIDNGYTPEVYMAVEAKQLNQPLDIDHRIKAVASFAKCDEAPSLANANKRVANILAKNKVEASQQDLRVDENLLVEEAEKNLSHELNTVSKLVEPLVLNGDYQEALTELAKLKQSIDRFFDSVMVMSDDEALKNNRLALLKRLRELFLQIADISYLAIK